MQKCAVEDAAKVEVSVCFNFIDEIWGGLGVGGGCVSRVISPFDLRLPSI